MAKKSFRDSPALQFITAAEVTPEVAQPPESPPVQKAEKKPAKAPAGQSQGGGGQRAKATPQAKKTAAAAGGAGEGARAPAPKQPAQPVPPSTTRPDAPVKLNPMYIETRSKRVQLLMQPTLHDKLRSMAAQRGQSLNDLVHMALERFADEDLPE